MVICHQSNFIGAAATVKKDLCENGISLLALAHRFHHLCSLHRHRSRQHHLCHRRCCSCFHPAITVPKCAVIVKLVNSTRHEFQIVPVESPAPGDYYWQAAPQTVFFESSDLIEVTRQKDVFVGDMVKFVISSSEIAAAAACRVPRGVRFNSPLATLRFKCWCSESEL